MDKELENDCRETARLYGDGRYYPAARGPLEYAAALLTKCADALSTPPVTQAANVEGESVGMGEVQRLRNALTELRAMVKGECPSLLNEDSGGNGELAIEIEELLK